MLFILDVWRDPGYTSGFVRQEGEKNKHNSAVGLPQILWQLFKYFGNVILRSSLQSCANRDLPSESNYSRKKLMQCTGCFNEDIVLQNYGQ